MPCNMDHGNHNHKEADLAVYGTEVGMNMAVTVAATPLTAVSRKIHQRMRVAVFRFFAKRENQFPNL